MATNPNQKPAAKPAAPAPTAAAKAPPPKAAPPKPSALAAPAKPQSSELATARPDYVETGLAGLENMRGKDIQFPLMQLMQPGSPKVQRNEIKAGSILNSLNGDVVFEQGESAEVIPFLHFVSWIEWRHRDEGGGIIAQTMDPRSALAARAERNERMDPEDPKSPLKVTEYHNFLCLLPAAIAEGKPVEECVLMVPCAKTNFKRGRRLLMMARARQTPLYAGLYVLTTEMVTRDKYTWYEVTFENAGWASKEQYEMAKAAYERYAPMLAQGKIAYAPPEEEVPAEADVSTPAAGEERF